MKSFWKSRNLFTKRFLAAGGKRVEDLQEIVYQKLQPLAGESCWTKKYHPLENSCIIWYSLVLKRLDSLMKRNSDIFVMKMDRVFLRERITLPAEACLYKY
jgi:hypothetical protein